RAIGAARARVYAHRSGGPKTRFPMRRSVSSLALLLSVVSAPALAADRPHFDAYPEAVPFVSRAVAPSRAPRAVVTSIDTQRGVPTFLWAPRDASAANAAAPGATPELAARAHLARHAARYGLGAEALAAAELVQVHDIGRGGIIAVFGQRAQGVEVFRRRVK